MEGSPQGGSGERPPQEKRKRRTGIRVGAVVALAALAGVAALAIVEWRSDSSDGTSATTAAQTVPKTGPIKVSVSGLRTLSEAFNQPIYWIGPERGFTYELTRTTDANVYLRYLPAGVEVGDPRPNFTIIGTYPYEGAYDALKELGGGREVPVPGGGIALPEEAYPQSVHLAFPDLDYQLEVYDPSPKRALRIATSGDVVPVSP